MNDTTQTAPAPNTPEARTETGALKDQSPTTQGNEQQAQQGEAKPGHGPDTSLLNQDGDKKPEGDKKPAEGKEGEAKPKEGEAVPLKLEDIKAPEGFEINKEAMEAALPVFNELGINAEGASKLLGLYQSELAKAEEAPYEAWANMRADWQKEITSDPDIGKNIPAVKADLGRMYDLIAEQPGGATVVKEFKEVMDLTGAGDNVRFVRLFHRLAKMVGEGNHVQGTKPSPHGQSRTGTNDRPTGAQAMYPNLPSAGR